MVVTVIVKFAETVVVVRTVNKRGCRVGSSCNTLNSILESLGVRFCGLPGLQWFVKCLDDVAVALEQCFDLHFAWPPGPLITQK